MKKFSMIAVVAVVLCVVTQGLHAAEPTCKKKADAPKRVLRHVVLLKFKEGTKPAQIKAVENGFRALPGKIDAICDFEWGTDASVEGLTQGFTHCFFVTFRNEKGRAAYLPHPQHKKFVELLTPYLDKVLVIDYWASK